MHEMSCLVRLVDLASKRAKAEGGGKILSMEVSVGAMTGIVPYYLRLYFPQASKGTPAEGAELIIKEVPVLVCCSGCGTHYEPDQGNGRRCPVCGNRAGRVTGGRDITLDSIRLTQEMPFAGIDVTIPF